VKIPRDVSGMEAVRALKRFGFVQPRTVVVPQHKPLKPGTLKGIVEQAGLSLEEFTDHL
jgi:predicted RNA binding protein YcfA (HicA-like mRNA interferase family)